jgi:hypothetical protein
LEFSILIVAPGTGLPVSASRILPDTEYKSADIESRGNKIKNAADTKDKKLRRRVIGLPELIDKWYAKSTIMQNYIKK